ncbi:hypothetical protein LINPERHAP1_LOCUS20282 [Linum perenne]
MHDIAMPDSSTQEAREQEAGNGKRHTRHNVQNLDAHQLPPHRNPTHLRDAPPFGV